jgi:hypothetical protein
LNNEQKTYHSLLYSLNQPPRLRRLAKNDQLRSSLQFDQYVAETIEGHSEHDELLFGQQHNDNGGFTVHRNNGVEIGLRTKLSYPVIENEYNSNGDGTYSWDRVGCDGGDPNDSKVPHWSMDFSVATYSNNIGGYCACTATTTTRGWRNPRSIAATLPSLHSETTPFANGL